MRARSSHLPFLASATMVLAATILPLPAAPAASGARLTVDAKGELRASAAVLRTLGVKPGRDRRVWMQFPAGPVPAPKSAGAPGGHEHPMRTEAIPPKFWLNVRGDGSIAIRRMRVPGTRRFVPGPPGTAYTATGQGDRLILRKVDSRRR
jgi:hypothetical protein